MVGRSVWLEMCVYVCVLAHVCVYSLRIASSDKILCFINTLIIINNVLNNDKGIDRRPKCNPSGRLC